MSPTAARTAADPAAATTARRLVGSVVVLTSATPLAAAAGTVLLDGTTGPLWWAAPLLAAFAACLLASAAALVRGAPPDPPAAALVVLGAVTVVSQALLVRSGAAEAAVSPLHGPWPAYVAAVATQAAAVLVRNAPVPWGLAATTAFSALVAALAPVPPPLAQDGVGGAAESATYAAVLALVAASIFCLTRSLELDSGRVRAARGAVQHADAEAEALALAAAERGRWEAAVHDDVLSALRAGAAARTPEGVRAASAAAAEALARLATPPATLTVGTALAAQQVEAAARGAFEDVELAVTTRPGSLPGRVVEALADATAELMRNTVRHNSPGVRARVEGHLDGDGVRLRVSDDGSGFDVAALPTGRLGVRVSVVGRLRSVGGDAEVTSSPRGTAAHLRWPR